MTVRVVPEELDRAAARYEATALTTAAAAEHFPSAVHAGSATPALVGMLAQVATGVAGLVQMLGLTGGMLAACADAYREADTRTAAEVVTTWSENVE